jgi:4-coumarate--CoA ligase (photoactive yellow protein activation family)
MLERDDISRVVQDCLRAEISRARCGDIGGLPPEPWPDSIPIGPEGLGADSLELMALAGAVNAMFHIHDSGMEDMLLASRRFGDWVDLVARSWHDFGTRISFSTSGSTGQPKRCTHAMADLRAEIAEHAATLRPARILSAVPSHHIYGFLFSALLPRVAGCKLIDIRSALPAMEAYHDGDVIVSFPDHWRYLAQSLERLPPVVGVTSTAPMPEDLARDLRARGLRRLVEIYGASETAGIGWRDFSDAPFALLDRWTVAEAPGAEGGILRLSGPDGKIAETPDMVVMVGARNFRVQRRADGAVQVGGINVFPQRIAALLETHPLVGKARVRCAAPAAGGRLKALIVPRDPGIDPETILRELRPWIAERLRGPEQPRALTVAKRIPTGPLGKEIDWTEAT